MKLEYYEETDSLYIHLSSRPSANSDEVAEGIVVDYDEAGNVVGIDIDNASGKIELDQLTLEHLPVALQKLTA